MFAADSSRSRSEFDSLLIQRLGTGPRFGNDYVAEPRQLKELWDFIFLLKYTRISLNDLIVIP